MTNKEAKDITVELWSYLVRHPHTVYKSSVPEELFNKIKFSDNLCPLCELFLAHEKGCPGCPLSAAGQQCETGRDAYENWCNAVNIDDRSAAANKIVKIVSEWEV